MRGSDKDVVVKGIGDVDFDLPLKFKCKAGLTYNLAAGLKKKIRTRLMSL